MSNKKQIEASLKRLILDDDREFVAMLSGEWGIGKTYFWKEFTTKHLKEKNVAYISLFGKNSLADIETEVVTKLYRYNKGLKKYSKHLNTVSNMVSKAIGLPINVSAGSLLSLFSPSDFKNIIICFDDFERLSDKVALKDVMGLISQFNEQKECKVIMILNKKELDKLSGIDGKKHDEIFALYKEKVVDYTFHYKPNQKELFEAIKEDIEKIAWCEPQTIYDFFEKIELKNIRIMKQALYQLNYFSFIGSENYDNKVLNEFVEVALNLLVFKAKSNHTYTEVQNMQKVEAEDATIVVNENPIHQHTKLYYFPLPYFHQKEELEEIIDIYIDTHLLYQEELLTILKAYNDKLDNNSIRDQIFTIYNEARFSFSSNLSQCAKKIFNLLKNNKTTIPYIFAPMNLELYLNFIVEHNSSIMTKEFRDGLIKLYIDFKPDGERNRFSLIDYEKFIEKFYPHLMTYLEDAIEEETKEQININDIQAKLDKFSSHTSYNNQDIKFLNSLSSAIYKQHIEESEDFYNEVTAFLSIRISTELNKTTKNLKKALLELSKENKDNAWRISMFTQEANINLEVEE